MTLSLYIARRFLLHFLGIFGVFVALILLLDMIEQVRRLAGTEAGILDVARLAALNLPKTLHQILPLVTVLAALSLFRGLARSSELVVMRAAGRSGISLMLAPVLVALALGTAALAVLNPLVAATEKRYEALLTQFRSGDEASTISVSAEGLWLRQAGPLGQIVIHAAGAGPDGTWLRDATFLEFVPGAGPVRRIMATEAQLTPGSWVLTNAKVWDFDAANPERDARTHPEFSLPSDLTAERIRDSFGSPATIPLWELPRFIATLEQAGFSARQHRMWLQMELALPLMLAAMVMVGAGFSMRHVRARGAGVMVLSAIVAAFAIHFLRNFAQILGENGQLPAALAAWSPPAVGALLALSLMLHLEDG